MTFLLSVLTLGYCFLATAGLSAQDARRTEPESRPTVKPTSPEPREFQLSGELGSRLAFAHLAESPGLHVSNDIYSLLQYKPIRNAIQVTDTQVSQLAAAQVQQIRIRQEAMRELSELNGPGQFDPGSSKLYEDSQAKQRSKTEELYREILLPQQIQRLEEIAFELRIQSAGIVAFLKDPQMIAELELSEEQLTELQKRAVRASQNFDAKVMELKRQIRGEVISVLNEDQRARFDGMLGQSFDWMRASDADSDDD